MTAAALQRLHQLGHGREQVGHQPVVGDLKIGASGVLVDRDDHLGVLHAGQVLDRAGDAEGDVELRRDDLAGLADLLVVGRVARIDRGAARAERRAELVGQRREHLVELVARCPARGRRETMILAAVEFGPFVLGDLAADEADRPLSAAAATVSIAADAAAGRRGIEAGGAHGDHLDRVEALHRGDRVAGVDRALEGVGG